MALKSVFAALTLLACAFAENPPTRHRRPTPEYGFRVLHVFPHDPSAFTQGLEYRGGFLYEGTGMNGHSALRKVELQTGKVVQETRLAPQFFGEGITVIDQRITQLTWQSEVGFIYDQLTFKALRTFQYPGEGWGLANDGKQIYMSDGSAQIRCLDPMTLREQRRFTVHEGAHPIVSLNELEWVRGELFANVWQTDRVVRIAPDDGRVLGWVDLSGLLPEEKHGGADVLNGIAYDSMGDRLFVTGKLWPRIFEIQLLPKKKITASPAPKGAR
jgi:glutamine cyclotransferase